jgi:hypothetical protein
MVLLSGSRKPPPVSPPAHILRQVVKSVNVTKQKHRVSVGQVEINELDVDTAPSNQGGGHQQENTPHHIITQSGRKLGGSIPPLRSGYTSDLQPQ